MEEDDLEIAIKVLVVGNGGVGKSSLIQRYCKGTYTDGYKKTIGVDFLEKSLEIDGQEVKMMLWDTAGQEEFDSITKSYYRGANCCVLAFSITDRNSFEAVERWKSKVVDQCGGSVCMVIVQNKMDLLDSDSANAVNFVTSEEGEELAKRLKMRLHRISVKQNEGVGPVFEHLCAKYLSNLKKEKKEAQQVTSGSIASSEMGMFSTTIAQTSNDQKSSNGTDESDGRTHNPNNTINLKPLKSRGKTKKKPGCVIL